MKQIFGLALGQIHPEGWLRGFLETQRDGLTGHLEHAGYPFDTKGWLDDELKLGDRGGAGWWPYEQTAYWVDGMLRCGLLLDDVFLLNKARKQIDHVMRHPDKDGYLGPALLKHLHGPRGSERWPHAVFFRAVLADLEQRPNDAYLERLRRHYLSGTARHETTRNVCNIEIMAWLFRTTGDRRLLDMAEESYRAFQQHESSSGATLTNMLSDEKAGDHGPTYMELFKLGAVMFSITGNRRYLRAAENAQRKLERDHVLIDGVPSATEHMRGIYSNAGHETCVITDYVWSLGWLLETTGKVKYADAMERACFNALPGAVTADFKALQYFSGPNQVIAGPQTNHHPHGTGSTHISYRPNPATECCPGNVHRAMPAFAGRMWGREDKSTIVAALYGPCRLELDDMIITEETEYPFLPIVRFRFAMAKTLMRTFRFRVPGWCWSVEVRLNGKPLKGAFKPGSWGSLKRMFRDGDMLELYFDYEVEEVAGPEDSVAYVWGPLVMALPVKARRKRERKDKRSSDAFPAWTFKPDSAWNYGVERGQGYELIAAGATGNPWTEASAPVRLMLPARRIPGWRLKQTKRLVIKHREWMKVVKGDIAFTPLMPGEAVRRRVSKKEDMIELVPMGAAKLRVTWFPRIMS
jgi:uncharacterized protein